MFGSFARADESATSDVDRIADFTDRKSLMDLVRIERELSERLGRNVDLLTEAALSPYVRDQILATLAWSMSAPRDDSVYLGHIRDAIARIESYLQGVSEADFLSTPMVQDAVMHQIQGARRWQELVSQLGCEGAGNARSCRHGVGPATHQIRMNVFHILSLILLFVVSGASSAVQAQAVGPDGGSRADVVLSDSHTFVVSNSITGVGYRIYVAFPPGYHSSSKRYPALYMLDGDGGFALGTQAYRLLRVDSTMPDLLLVGIGYDLTGASRRSQRGHDLTPTRVASDTATGGSGAFLHFLVETIIPTVESHYRTDPSDRGLFGHSLGGLFALHTLFARPDVFRRYIVSSPSLWWDDAVILKAESRFAREQRRLPKSIYMSVGSEEPFDMLERFQPFADSIQSRGYSGLTFTAAVLPNETHLSAFATAFTRGLRTVYK